jgi:hypothetical protein
MVPPPSLAVKLGALLRASPELPIGPRWLPIASGAAGQPGRQGLRLQRYLAE